MVFFVVQTVEENQLLGGIRIGNRAKNARGSLSSGILRGIVRENEEHTREQTQNNEKLRGSLS